MKSKSPDLKVHGKGRSKVNKSGVHRKSCANFFTGEYQFSNMKKNQKMPKGSVVQLSRMKLFLSLHLHVSPWNKPRLS